MLNLVAMIFMCIVIVGILLIYLVIILEGSLYANPIIFVHLTIPAFTLALNLYIIMLEDNQEYKYFRKGSGFFLMNFSFLISVVALTCAVYFKFFYTGFSNDEDGNNSGNSNRMPKSTALGKSSPDDATEEGILFIEECLIHALGVIESFTLKEYSKAKF